ncbi:PQQ-dependent sugar dehydrogenase [Marinactinospora rubrisoli]|uniref:PQQ-dependent sugar dehydrogenase n=1 Tax=Marinactinospora rubrisoli TaxID=2715399 RepID=A0ABW2KCS7_9ACTN
MRHPKWLGALLGVVLTVGVGCAAAPPPEQVPSPTDGGANTAVAPSAPEDVATGLEVPWAVDFLPDGSALATERDSARIVRIQPDGTTQQIGVVPGVAPQGEGGLLGLAVSPDFESDRLVYVYFTSDSDNRIVRMTYDPAAGLGTPEPVLEGIPSAGIHNGGRIAFGPDGMLYAGTGDANERQLSQDIDSVAGKILRMTPEGEVPDDNPFGNLVYSYGHRNVQGLAWDGDTLLATEFGQNTYDEVNVIRPGGNYGWPEVEGVGGQDGFVDPVVTWTTAEASPSGAAVADGSLWVAALRGQRLWRVPLTGDPARPVGEPESLFTGEFGRLRDVVAAPGGGGIWLTTSNRDGRGTPADGDDRVLRVGLGE